MKGLLIFCMTDVDRALQLKFTLPKRKQRLHRNTLMDWISHTSRHEWKITPSRWRRVIKKLLGYLSGTMTWAHARTNSPQVFSKANPGTCCLSSSSDKTSLRKPPNLISFTFLLSSTTQKHNLWVITESNKLVFNSASVKSSKKIH